MNALSALKDRLAQVKDIESAAHVLEWDQETYMPSGAAEARAHQIATLRQLAHERFTSDRVGDLIQEAGAGLDGADPLDTSASIVRVAKKDYEKARKLPAELVAELARSVSRAKEAWKEARETDTFSTFAPLLAHLIELNIEKAEALGYDKHAYDALLDQYEPGMTTDEVKAVFTDLRARLVPIVHTLKEAPQPENAFLRAHYEHQKQWDFGLSVIQNFGYDFERGRQDLSTHPFTTSFSIEDVRLTTRIQEDYFPTGLFGTIHEAGHGLYEQGIDRALDRTPLAEGTSLGMHESQSRLWENMVGRSRPFWTHYYPQLQRLFPGPLGEVSLEQFYRAINRVAPSLIRVEADEVTYNLHIMLRFELETALIAGDLSVDDLPFAWNSLMQKYLDVTPDTDAEGVLQDIHWSLGVFGYFPTYALGNLMSAQLFEKAESVIDGLEEQMAQGHFKGLLGWLRLHVHQYGRKLLAKEILERATGSSLQSDSWLNYIQNKYASVYDV